MADCSKIAAGLAAAACNSVAVPGTAARVVLLSYADVDRTTLVDTANVVSMINTLGVTVGYSFESLPDASVGSFALSKGTYINQFEHTIDLRIFAKTEAGKVFVNGLKNGRVVAIVENLYFNASDTTPVKYEIYGLSAGLELSEATGTTTYEDQTVYTMKLASPEDAKEGSLPKTLFLTSIAATDTLVSGLLV